ncbi:ABC transporter permease [Anaerobaca lacustris]|uniref:ABC transporter permease n=1 Tax=Anaerobaca lacustris TaxID=3044600 RepID=A0AAW6TQN2_9BACT|nr:ABC transporter permease [Sedimentisphaerales bacterium M17dextr]
MRQTRIARNVWLGIENLLLHKLRSFLTMLGVVFGVGSVVAMLSVGEGASMEAMDNIRKLGSNNIIISSVKPSADDQQRTTTSFMSVYGLTYEDHRRIAESFGNIKQVAPVKLTRKETRLRERSMELRIVGTTPEWFDLVPREVLAGRVLLPPDQARRAPVVVLTEFGARKVLATEAVVGQTIRIGGDEFEVIGIVRSESGQAGNIQIPDQEADAYIPMEVARRYFGDFFVKRTSGAEEREKVELHQVIVQVEDPKGVEAVAAGIERMLERFHKKKDYTVSVPLALLKQAEATKRTFNIVLGSIAGISLLVGGIGIMNIMLASVTERTREIGIRRAIGAKRKQIIYQFLVETVVLSTTGGLIGLGVGILIPLLITYFSGMATVVTLNGILLPLFISMGIGILFGLYPAINAAKVDPIIALRHE